MVEGTRMRQPRWIRILLWVLGGTSLINGIAMFFAPSVWFFRMVPGVPETGPFNAHLVADSGTFFIAVGVGLLIAGFDPKRNVAVVIVAAIANLFPFDPAYLFALKPDSSRSGISAPRSSAFTFRPCC